MGQSVDEPRIKVLLKEVAAAIFLLAWGCWYVLSYYFKKRE
jgi:hypothetical protein